MKNVCFYFNAHQPNRLKPYTFFDIGNDHFYEDDLKNKQVLEACAATCYLPMNALLMDCIQELGKDFKICMSLSGTLIEQMENHRPNVLKSFIELAKTGQVEFLAETFYYSLSSVYSPAEFERQIQKNISKVEEHFGQKPTIFRNTGMVYSNEIAARIEAMGYKGILCEGLDKHLHGRSYNKLYRAPNVSKIKTILKNYKLSGDITHRFTDKNWVHHPLTAEKYSKWITHESGDCVNIFMTYETIGRHIKAETGIFQFMKSMFAENLKRGLNYKYLSELVEEFDAKDTLDIHVPVSWKDSKKDLSAYLNNPMQEEAILKLYSLEETVINSKDKDLIHVWSKLQTADHFYYLGTKSKDDGATRDYLSPYKSPYDGYIYYMNALADLEITCKERRLIPNGE